MRGEGRGGEEEKGGKEREEERKEEEEGGRSWEWGPAEGFSTYSGQKAELMVSDFCICLVHLFYQ